MPQENFFYSNLFIAIITLIVGLFGFALYILRNSDAKRRTARIIMLEITNAEAQLRDARNRLEESEKSGAKKLPEHLYVMPLDTWTGSRHLFVNDFKTSEWEAINEFYSKCRLFDEAIEYNDQRFSKDEQQIRENVHRATYDMALQAFKSIDGNTTDDEKINLRRTLLMRRNEMATFLTAGQNLWIYTPTKELRDVEYIISSINYNISTSSVGTKMTKLAKRRFWFTINKN